MSIFTIFTKEAPELKESADRRFGWKRDLHDQNDFKFKVVEPVPTPPLIDLTPFCPPVYNQGNLGSCTANALAAAYEFEKMKQKQPYFMPSRLFIYYNERVMENTVKSDAGAALRDGIKSLNTQGVCPEDMWTYNVIKFATKPSCKCYTTAKKNEIKEYLSVNHTSIADIRQCLAQGYPIAFGISVYSSFMSDEVAKTGIVPMPKIDESLEGGHAILGVGYNDTIRMIIVRNSWGINWGIKGYFLLPYDYITSSQLASDFWTIRLVA
jgi:C1A family cysteine protease